MIELDTQILPKTINIGQVAVTGSPDAIQFPQHFSQTTSYVLGDFRPDLYKQLPQPVSVIDAALMRENALTPLRLATNNLPALTKHEQARFQILYLKYKNELNAIHVSNVLADKVCVQMAAELCKIDFIRCAVEITPGSVIKFTLVLENDQLLMVSKSFEPNQENVVENQIVFSFFIKRELTVTDAADLKEFVKGFRKYHTL